MINRILTVGGLTLLSRVTGFARDIMLAAILGAGPVADAFFVALRLPNHFRAIFAEGAFNAAFVPAYARIRQHGGAGPASLFADRIFTLLFASQVVLLGVALVFTPGVIALLAPGFNNDPGRFALAVELTRITFPYLLLVTMVTLYGGMLNVIGRFASAAAAPILLNVSMVGTLALAAWFPTVGHAAAWGVFLAGCLELLLVAGDVARRGLLPVFRRPKPDPEVKRFFKALGPATLGSAGTQIALFADTIIASFLATGALSALYYADRLNQLPIGVIGIAVGTVLLPEMANRIARSDEAGAQDAQNRAIELTLLLSIPCFVAFTRVPELFMLALFTRGAFTVADAAQSGATLMAYAFGLLPFVLLRSVSATFLARGDTKTLVKALFVAVAVNVMLKIMLMGSMAQTGLALATSVGAWINFALLLWFAWRARLIAFDKRLQDSVLKLALAGIALDVAFLVVRRFFADAGSPPTSRQALIELGILVVVGAIVYGGAIMILLGRRWLLAFRGQIAPPGTMPDTE